MRGALAATIFLVGCSGASGGADLGARIQVSQSQSAAWASAMTSPAGYRSDCQLLLYREGEVQIYFWLQEQGSETFVAARTTDGQKLRRRVARTGAFSELRGLCSSGSHVSRQLRAKVPAVGLILTGDGLEDPVVLGADDETNVTLISLVVRGLHGYVLGQRSDAEVVCLLHLLEQAIKGRDVQAMCGR